MFLETEVIRSKENSEMEIKLFIWCIKSMLSEIMHIWKCCEGVKWLLDGSRQMFCFIATEWMVFIVC